MPGQHEQEIRWRYYKPSPESDTFRKELKGLPNTARAVLLATMNAYRHGRALPRQVDHLGDGIYEIRITDKGNEYRVLFHHPVARYAVALHAFQKKTQKTPPAKIKLAKRRRSIWDSGPH